MQYYAYLEAGCKRIPRRGVQLFKQSVHEIRKADDCWTAYRRARRRLARYCGQLATPCDRDFVLFDRLLASVRIEAGL